MMLRDALSTSDLTPDSGLGPDEALATLLATGDALDAYAASVQGPGEPDSPARFDLLDVMEGMGGFFHEHHNDIMRWSWKLFCRKWARMVEKSTIQEVERRDRARKRQDDARAKEALADMRFPN